VLLWLLTSRSGCALNSNAFWLFNVKKSDFFLDVLVHSQYEEGRYGVKPLIDLLGSVLTEITRVFFSLVFLVMAVLADSRSVFY
jgi:hypothetical protein